MSETVLLASGPLRVHAATECQGRHCVIHNPSAHPMRDWPLVWRSDRQLMERICPHGVGHPDPDHVAFLAQFVSAEAAALHQQHGCDGCCDEPPGQSDYQAA
jgi:hypothetical protein